MKILECGVEIEVILDSSPYPTDLTELRYDIILQTSHLSTIPLRAIKKDAALPLDAARRLARAELAYTASLEPEDETSMHGFRS
jgi:hypothetical protein